MNYEVGKIENACIFDITTGKKIMDIPVDGLQTFDLSKNEQNHKRVIELSTSANFECTNQYINSDLLYRIIEPQNNDFTFNTTIKELVQVRKHKKKRINKKWLKRYGCREMNTPVTMIASYVESYENGGSSFEVKKIKSAGKVLYEI